jgi:hypothetical protein
MIRKRSADRLADAVFAYTTTLQRGNPFYGRSRRTMTRPSIRFTTRSVLFQDEFRQRLMDGPIDPPAASVEAVAASQPGDAVSVAASTPGAVPR